MTLICISLMTSDVELVFHVPVGHFYGTSSSWVSCSAFQSFVSLEILKGAFRNVDTWFPCKKKFQFQRLGTSVTGSYVSAG